MALPLENRISPAAYERCLERSSLRRRGLMMAVSLGESFPRQLAAALRIDCGRLNAILHGDGKDYAKDLGLVSVGLLAERMTPHGRVIHPTEAGRRKARQMSARQIRREATRRERREAKQAHGRDHGSVAPVAEPVVTPVAAPPDTHSYRWSTEA